ncbi:MAG TPA: hypothetical protein VNX21_08950 [Candidatus Thermoplasmatota archaeon]|nr:hypothetical protein [Candidatus Thermoplasmatota archaeon]
MRKAKDDTAKHADVGNVETKDPDFPNLTAMEAQNREQHVARAVEAGLSREEAERHAEDDAKHWSPRNVEEKPHED